MVQTLRGQQQINIVRDNLQLLRDALNTPDNLRSNRATGQGSVKRQVPVVVVLPEQFKPGALGSLLDRLQQQEGQLQQLVTAGGAANNSLADCGCSSGAGEQRKGSGTSSGQQQQQQEEVAGLTAWSLLASPVGVFYEGYGEGFLTAVSVRQQVDGLCVDYQLYRRGEVVFELRVSHLVNLGDIVVVGPCFASGLLR